MDTLKLKFKLHSLEFEIEGKEEIVKEEFSNFKNFIAGEFLQKVVSIPYVMPEPIKSSSLLPNSIVGGAGDFEYPPMKEIVMKDLPNAETDWVLLYALYATDFGNTTFSEKEIKSFYETTGRKNVSRTNNLSNNMKSLLNKGYIKMHNDTEYLIKEEGIAYAKQILTGNSTTKLANKKVSVSKKIQAKVTEDDTEEKAKKSKSSNSISFVDLNMPAVELKSLTDFFAEKNPTTQNEEVIVVMKWYKDKKNINEISFEEINYLLSITSKPPSAMAQVLGNMVGARYRWVTKGSIGKYVLSSVGENYILNKLPRN